MPHLLLLRCRRSPGRPRRRLRHNTCRRSSSSGRSGRLRCRRRQRRGRREHPAGRGCGRGRGLVRHLLLHLCQRCLEQSQLRIEVRHRGRRRWRPDQAHCPTCPTYQSCCGGRQGRSSPPAAPCRASTALAAVCCAGWCSGTQVKRGGDREGRSVRRPRRLGLATPGGAGAERDAATEAATSAAGWRGRASTHTGRRRRTGTAQYGLRRAGGWGAGMTLC